MDPQRIERNSHLYEEILSELQQQNSMRSSKSHIVSNRKDYARLDIGSMGVDLKENFRYFIFDSSNGYFRDKTFEFHCLILVRQTNKVY